jgi:hypothetical protein
MSAVEDIEIDDPLAALPGLDPLAPKALERKTAARIALDELEGLTPRLSLNRSNEVPGAAVALRDHLARITAAKAEYDLAAIAHDEALDQDAAAAARRIAAIRALDPEDAVIGITVHDCCDGCGDTECMIAGGLNRCMHPQKGGVPPAHHNDRVISSFYCAARDEIVAQIAGDDDDDDNEEGVAA